MVRWYPVFLFLCAITTPDLRHIAGIRGFSIIEVTMEAPSVAIIVIDQQWGLQALSRESPGPNRGLALDSASACLLDTAQTQSTPGQGLRVNKKPPAPTLRNHLCLWNRIKQRCFAGKARSVVPKGTPCCVIGAARTNRERHHSAGQAGLIPAARTRGKRGDSVDKIASSLKLRDHLHLRWSHLVAGLGFPGLARQGRRT
jgi:hypothetical protein